MARRARGEGSVYESNLRGKFRYWEGYVFVGGDKVYRRSSVPGRKGELDCQQKLKAAAEEIAAERQAEADAANPRSYTLWAAIEDWHRWVPTQAETSQQTADTLFGQARKWVEPRIGSTPVFDVDLELLSNFFEEIADDLGTSSLGKVKGVIIRALNYAMRRKSETGYAGPNPASDVVLPQAGRKPRGKDFLTQEASEDVIAAAEGTRMHALVMTGFMLGLRPGEIRALKWEHVDLAKGVLYVVRYARKTGDGNTKTASSRRAFKIPARLLAAYKWHAQHCGGGEYVFDREDGRQLDRDSLAWRFGVLMRKAGIDGIEDPYVMRHSFASICYANDVPVKKISELMGHANERVTLTVYIHLFNPDVTDTGGLDDIWGSAA